MIAACVSLPCFALLPVAKAASRVSRSETAPGRGTHSICLQIERVEGFIGTKRYIFELFVVIMESPRQLRWPSPL